MSVRRRRWLRIALPVVVVLGLMAGVPAIREAGLRTLGRALVVDEPVGPVDAIVLPQWAGGAGAIDTADLVHRGIAPRVAVLSEPPKPSDLELGRRGIPFPDETADLIQLLRSLGVAEIERIPTPVAGTEDEASVISSWCEQHGLRSIVLVSSPDHSRRVRRVVRRSLSGHTMAIAIRSARYSSFDPDHWWETRENVRTAIIELQKLFLDIVRHPIS
jgi:hypothetical protein